MGKGIDRSRHGATQRILAGIVGRVLRQGLVVGHSGLRKYWLAAFSFL
jgi:hypothetical protein